MEKHDLWKKNEKEKERKWDRIFKAREKAISKRLMDMFIDEMEDNPAEFTKMLPDEFHDRFISYNEKRSGGRYKYVMVTVNFNEDAILEEIFKKIRKACKKCWIENWEYCLETRNDIGDGIHCHIRLEVKGKKKPSDMKREMYNTFKHLVGNKLHVNLRFSNRDGAFKDYVRGIKGGEPKENMVNDVKWRKAHNISDLYVGPPGG